MKKTSKKVKESFETFTKQNITWNKIIKQMLHSSCFKTKTYWTIKRKNELKPILIQNYHKPINLICVCVDACIFIQHNRRYLSIYIRIYPKPTNTPKPQTPARRWIPNPEIPSAQSPTPQPQALTQKPQAVNPLHPNLKP